jgi:hypothetical protein
VVVFDKDQSHLVARDALVRSFSKLSQELESKLEELEAIKKSGKDGAEVQSRQLDIDVLTTTYRKCASALREMDMEAEAPKRIRLIQPATARQE